jgi:hypothetical protein
MGNNGSGGIFDFVCSRCDRIIKPDERMLTISVSTETPTRKGAVECIESYAISSLCLSCASILLSEAVINKGLVTPTTIPEEVGVSGTTTEETMHSRDNRIKSDFLIKLMSDERAGQVMLRVHCSEQGFRFTLQCSDSISWANSQLFTWNQIAQLLIAANPDMFGVLDEPLHQVFPRTLTSLGYTVPNWRT